MPEVLHVLETKMHLSPALCAQVTSVDNALSIMKDRKIDHTKASLVAPVRKTQAPWLAALRKADADKLGESTDEGQKTKLISRASGQAARARRGRTR